MTTHSSRFTGVVIGVALLVAGWVLSRSMGEERICSEMVAECLVEVSTFQSQLGVFLMWLSVPVVAVAFLASWPGLEREGAVAAGVIAVLMVPFAALRASDAEVTVEAALTERALEEARQAGRDAAARGAPVEAETEHGLPAAPPGAFQFTHGWASVSKSAPAGQRCVLADECWTITVELDHACSGDVSVAGILVLDGARVDGFSSQPLSQNSSGTAGRFSRQLPLGLRDVPAGVDAEITSVRCLSWAGGHTPPANTEARG